MSKEAQASWDQGIAWLKAAGATIHDISLPHTKYALPAYYIVAPAECSSNLARYDGVRYGLRVPGKDLTETYENTRAAGFGKEVRRRVLMGTYVLSAGYYDAYYLKAQKIRRLIAEDFAEAFRTCDLILGPSSPSVAFKLGEKAADPVQMYLTDIYTVAANLAGLPAMSIPCGFGEGGMPVGLQMVGNYFAEARMLGAAAQYQRATDWHLRAPASA
jgi:aspartyl-tRNA(Asn)/glutamyl-tRNA(Gln) amidotransferase subunit A